MKYYPGDRVRITEELSNGNFYPIVGTVGTIIQVNDIDNTCLIQWPKGSTSWNDRWWLSPIYFEKVVE